MLEERIKEVLNDMDDNDIVSVWNTYCENVKCYDDMLLYMDEINDLYYGKEPLEIINTFIGSDFNINDDYFYYDGYGNPVSVTYAFDKADIDELTDYIIEENDSLDNDELREVLDEFAEEEEEDE